MKKTKYIEPEKLKMYCTDEEFLFLLKTKREQIQAGLEFDFYDCTDWGNKYVTCSWGVSQDDAQKHRLANYIGDKHRCPLRQKAGRDGCFSSCRVFKRKKDQAQITREECLELFDKRIFEVSQKIAESIVQRVEKLEGEDTATALLNSGYIGYVSPNIKE